MYFDFVENFRKIITVNYANDVLKLEHVFNHLQAKNENKRKITDFYKNRPKMVYALFLYLYVVYLSVAKLRIRTMNYS